MRAIDFSTTTSKLLVVLVGLSLGFSACTSAGTEETAPPVSDEVAEQDPTEITTTSSSVTTTSTTDTAPDTALAVDSLGKPLIEIPTEWESDLEEIFGRYQLYREALAIALGPPEADPSYEPLTKLVEELALDDVREQIEQFQGDGVVLSIPEESIGQHVLRLPNPAVLTKTEGNEVLIQDCWVNDTTVETIDGELRQVLYGSTLNNVSMRVIAGEWMVWAVREADEDSSGYSECADLIYELS